MRPVLKRRGVPDSGQGQCKSPIFAEIPEPSKSISNSNGGPECDGLWRPRVFTNERNLVPFMLTVCIVVESPAGLDDADM